MKNDLMLFGGEHETLMMERALGIVNVAVDYKELLMLKRCADIINQSDMEMLAIRQQIDETAAEPSTEEILFEKVKKVIM